MSSYLIDSSGSYGLTSSLADGNTNSRHLFTASNGRKIAILVGTNSVAYSTSADGQTWTTPAVIVSGTHLYPIWDYRSDTLTGFAQGTTSLNLNKFPYLTGSNTFGTGTGQVVTPPAAIQSMNAAWDTTQGCWHVAVADTSKRLNLLCLNGNGAILNSTYTTVLYTGANTLAIPQVAVIPGSTSTVLVLLHDGVVQKLLPLTLTLSGGAGNYIAGTMESTGATSVSDAAAALDNANLLDIIARDTGVGNNLYTAKRTGTNTYTAFTQIGANIKTSTATQGANFSLATDGGGGLYVLYVTTAAQANGEIYFNKRVAGSWAGGVLQQGGNATGYVLPHSVLAPMGTSLDYIFETGTANLGSIFASTAVLASTPSTPAITSPGAAVTTLTPTFAWSESFTPTDTQGDYELKVIRVSDSVTMWDSGKVASSASSGIVYGAVSNAGDVNFITPATLAFNVAYTVQVRVWESSGTNVSSYSPTSGFTAFHAGTPGIRSVAVGGGAASNGGSSSTLAALTAINATSLTVQTGQGSRFTNGQTIAVGVSGAVDVVTISGIATDTLTVSTMAHAHASTDPVIQLGSNSVTIVTAQNIILGYEWVQSESHTGNAYVATIFQADGTTVVATTSGTIAPAVASNAAATLPAWSPSGLANSTTYKASLILTDTTTGATATSPQWTLVTSWTPPGAPTAFTATPANDSGWIALAWTNNGSAVTVNVLRRPNGGSTWTTLSSGTLRTTLEDFPPVNSAFDYGVQTVDINGTVSSITTALNKTLGGKYGTYFHWLNDVTAPDTVNVALGAIDSTVDEVSTWQHIEDVNRWVPMGRTKPIASYGKTDYFQTIGRKYWIPNTDSTTTGASVITTLSAMASAHNVLLFRDTLSTNRYVTIENFSYNSVDQLHYNATFDLVEVAYAAAITVV